MVIREDQVLAFSQIMTAAVNDALARECERINNSIEGTGLRATFDASPEAEARRHSAMMRRVVEQLRTLEE